MLDPIYKGERVYRVVEKMIEKQPRFAVNWQEGERRGVLGGWFQSIADAVAAIERNEGEA